MIKFGNDIVTVGGDWLKMPPEPTRSNPQDADRLNSSDSEKTDKEK